MLDHEPSVRGKDVEFGCPVNRCLNQLVQIRRVGKHQVKTGPCQLLQHAQHVPAHNGHVRQTLHIVPQKPEHGRLLFYEHDRRSAPRQRLDAQRPAARVQVAGLCPAHAGTDDVEHRLPRYRLGRPQARAGVFELPAFVPAGAYAHGRTIPNGLSLSNSEPRPETGEEPPRNEGSNRRLRRRRRSERRSPEGLSTDFADYADDAHCQTGAAEAKRLSESDASKGLSAYPQVTQITQMLGEFRFDVPSSSAHEPRSKPQPKSPRKSLCKSRRESACESRYQSVGKSDSQSPQESTCESPSETVRMSRCEPAAESPGRTARRPRSESLRKSPREPFRERFPLRFAECRFQPVS